MTATDRTADVDVAVVGAGAAGIAAARELRARGIDCRILEARPRMGGRAWTEHDALGLPFDRGCAWLHDALNNPLRELAEAAGMALARGMRLRFHADGRFAGDEEAREIRNYLDRSFDELTETGRAGRDVAAAALVDRGHRHAPFLDYLLAAINGVDADAYSTGDAGEEEAGENWIVRDGLGALIVGRLGADLPAALGCPVRRIAWSDTGVRLETARGTVRARAAVVTASTGVLAGGGIAFAPDLPDWKRRALESLPMGRAEKIALRFDGDAFGTTDNTLVSIIKGERVLGFHLHPFGQPLAVCYTGGRLADTVADMEDGAPEAFALEYLEHAFGTGVRRRLRASTTTRWLHDPWARGSYSAALPGDHAQRAALARPLSPRLHFAGEATETGAFATAHGAWLSGRRAAGDVAEALDRQRP